MKKFILSLMFISILIPYNVYAISEYVIASGKNIGIKLNSKYILVVGSYLVEGHDILKESDLKIGDYITKINDNSVSNVIELSKEIKNSNNSNIKVNYIRNNIEYECYIDLFYKDNDYISGLYVKDTIMGVGTLTYIDIENKKFGALGHEIIEKNSKKLFESNDGVIFYSYVNGVNKSLSGNPGEKRANYNLDIIYGNILENTNKGIFGDYLGDIPNSKLYKVASDEDIKIGKASILTCIDGDNVKEYDIEILDINNKSSSKNILFKITDEELLKKTGGVIQGMSGSPIIQGDYIIGAVNYVIVNSPDKGYGIFISKMLEEENN